MKPHAGPEDLGPEIKRQIKHKKIQEIKAGLE